MTVDDEASSESQPNDSAAGRRQPTRRYEAKRSAIVRSAVEEMNRYSDRKIVFRDGRIPEKSIIGVFRAGDVERFAKAIEMDGFARVTAETDDFIELSAVQ